MTHSFDHNMRKELGKAANSINPSLQNYVTLLGKMGQLERKVRFNRRIGMVIFGIIIAYLVLSAIDPKFGI